VAGVTNRVGAEALRDVLEAARSASLARVDATGSLQLLPVAFRWRGGRAWVGLPRASAPPDLGAGSAVAVAADAGFFWWELRALLVRGTLAAGPAPEGGGAHLEWFELVPRTTTAWDYGSLREEELLVAP
jgi:hypothetical protein